MSLDSLMPYSNMPGGMLDSSFAQKSEPVVRMAEGGIADLPMDEQQAPRPVAPEIVSPESEALFTQLRQNISPKEFSDEMLASAEQADPQAVSEFRQALQELDVPPEVLDLLNNLIDEVMANPADYENIKQKYKAQGVTDDILPEQFDAQFFAALNLAVDQLRAEPAGPQAFAKGGIAELTPIAKTIASYGRNGDTMLAHITPAEARMLKRRGGAGTINPVTGLPEFANIFSRIGNAIKGFAKSTVGRIVIGATLAFIAGPAAAAALGVGSGTAAAAAISGFVGGAGSTLLAGGNLRDALKAGALSGIMGGATAALGGAPLMGEATMTPGEAFQLQVGKAGEALQTATGKAASLFDAPAKVYTEAGGAPVLPEAPTLPSQPALPGSTPAETYPIREAGAPLGRPLDRYDFMPDSAASQPAVAPPAGTPAEVATAAPLGTVEPPVSAGRVDLMAARDAVTAPANMPMTASQRLEALTRGFNQAAPGTVATPVPTVMDSIKTIGRGLGFGETPASYDTFKQGVSELFFPKGADQAAINAEANRLVSVNPKMPYETALKQATANMTPNVLRAYGPMAAAGLGIMGLAGGFRQPEVKSPYSDLFTGGPGSADYLLRNFPGQFYVQNLPGVRYYNGSVLPPPGYAHGGEVQHFEEGGTATADQLANEAAAGTPVANPAAQVTLSKLPVGVAAAPTTQVATPGVGGYNMYSPAAQNMYYGVINQGLLSGTQYNPQTRRNETVTISRPTVGTPYNTAAPYSALGGEPEPEARPAGLAGLFGDARAMVMPTPQRMPIQFPTGERLAEIEGSYRSLLGREPDVAGLMAFGSPQFNLSMQDIRNMMLASPERQQYLARLQAQQAPGAEPVVKPITTPMVQPRAPADPISGLPRIAAQNVAAVDTSKPIIVSSTAPAGYDYSAAAVTNDRETQINNLYRSILNRDAEQAGLNYWRDSGLSLSEIEAQIRKIAGDIGVPLTLPQNVPVADVSKPVTISSTAPVGYSYAAAPITNEREQQINALYRNILNRDAEQGGLNYWRDSGLSIPEIEAQIRKIAGDIGVTVAAPAVSSGSRSTLPPNVGGVGGTTGTNNTTVRLANAGGIASLGTGGYPRRTGQISGPGTEKSDSIPAMLSDGEFVMTAKAVRGAGNGSRRAGAKKMYALMNQLERNASRS